MNQQDITGALAGGGRYRATSYMVELTDAAGAVTEIIDANDIREVRRQDQTITIRRRKGRDVTLEAASLDDAGRLEAVLRAAAHAGSAPAKRSGGVGRKLMIGCGGLIGLVVLIAIIAAAAGGGSNSKEASGPSETRAASTSSASTTPAAPAGTAPAGEAPLAEGQSATVEGIRITILQLRDPYVPSNQFSRPSAGNRFVAFKVLIENVGNRDASANAFGFKLVDAESFQRQPTSVVFDEQSLLGQGQTLAAGTKIEGWFGFEVKQGVALKELTYDPNPFTNTDHHFRAP